MTPDEQTVERVAKAIDPEAFGQCPSHWVAMRPKGSDPEKLNEEWKVRTDWRRGQARKVARAAIAAMKEAGMDRLVAEGQKCDAMTPQEAAKVSDAELLDALAANYWDLKCIDIPTGGGDADVDWIIVEHHMGKKGDVTIAQAYTDDPRAALRRAISEDTQ